MQITKKKVECEFIRDASRKDYGELEFKLDLILKNYRHHKNLQLKDIFILHGDIVLVIYTYDEVINVNEIIKSFFKRKLNKILNKIRKG